MVRRPGQERCTLLPEALHVPSVAVGRVGRPTRVAAPDPPQRQGSHGGLRACAPGAWRPSVGCGPASMRAGLPSLRMARLPQARWPAGAPSAPGRLATALPHGGDTGAAAPRSTRGPPLAYRAQSRREACRVDGAGARQCGPPGLSRRRMTPRLQRVSTRPDGRKGGRHRRGSGVDQEPGGMPHGLLCRPWDRGGEGRPPGCERCSTSGVRRMTARVAGRGPPLLECLAWRPTAPQRADASGADGLTPGSPRRAIGMQHGRQPRAEPGAVRDHAASGRPERWARSGLGMLGPPGLAPVPRVDEPCALIVGIRRISLGAAG
jgi:hypothetical protein